MLLKLLSSGDLGGLVPVFVRGSVIFTHLQFAYQKTESGFQLRHLISMGANPGMKISLSQSSSMHRISPSVKPPYVAIKGCSGMQGDAAGYVPILFSLFFNASFVNVLGWSTNRDSR